LKSFYPQPPTTGIKVSYQQVVCCVDCQVSHTLSVEALMHNRVARFTVYVPVVCQPLGTWSIAWYSITHRSG